VKGASGMRDISKGQFENLEVSSSIECVKGTVATSDTDALTGATGMAHSKIQAITGATVSSRAVVAIINKSIEELREKLKN